MKKILAILLVALFATGSSNAMFLARFFGFGSHDSSIDDILKEKHKNSSIEYHRKKLQGFLYCVTNRPTVDQVEQALKRVREGKIKKDDSKIISINNLCSSEGYEWERSFSEVPFYNLFYHLRNLGEEMGWSCEKIANEKVLFFDKMMKIKEERAKAFSDGLIEKDKEPKEKECDH